MTNREKFKEVFDFEPIENCLCTSEGIDPDCLKNKLINSGCTKWLDSEYVEPNKERGSND